jgi:hypothetical protein
MASTPDQPKPKPDAPDAAKKPKGMTRKGFGQLLKRAFSPEPAKTAPKSK